MAALTAAGSTPDPVLPDYGGASLPHVAAALMAAPGERPYWVPPPAQEARQVVLLVVDGLGWEQLRERRSLAPTLAAMTGGPITSVAPTTTATALSSITLGTPPARHGMVGYRLRVPGVPGDEVLNALRWRTSSGDARERVDAATFLDGRPFSGQAVPVVSRATFLGTGFSTAHLRGTTDAPWYLPSAIAVEVGGLLGAGHSFVYAYYDGVDTTAHVRGLGAHYDAELTATDRIVADLVAVLPSGAALVVTADHGQVDVGAGARPLASEVLDGVDLISGEPRFRWLHAVPGAAGDVAAAAAGHYAGEAWVRTVDELDAEGWFGGPLDGRTRGRLGDVAIVPHAPVGYLDPADRVERNLVCRHGSLTAAEMLVPFLAAAP